MPIQENLFVMAIAICLSLVTPANAQDGQKMPVECQINPTGFSDWALCAQAAEPGSPEFRLAHANLGSAAFLLRDFETAARHYDNTIVPGQTAYMDPFLHAYRGATFLEVGRVDDASSDASIVLEYLHLGQADWQGNVPLSDPMRATLYENILPILDAVKSPQADSALEAYLALPMTDWIDALNRSGTLSTIGKYEEAFPLAETALEMQPDHPATQNNMCYLLASMGRGDEGIPYCETALGMAPNEPAILDSYAEALSDAGRCEEAISARRRARELFPSNPLYSEPLGCEAD